MHAQRMLRSTIVLVTALLVAFPSAAYPCGNPIHLAGNKAMQKVKKYEDQLKARKYQAILDDAYRFELTDKALQARADLIVLVAAMRGKKEPPFRPWRRDARRDDSGRSMTILDQLRELAAADADNPLLQARIAEALLLERGDKRVAEATTIMEDLAIRDLVPDPEAWLTLATVRHLAKDTTGAATAIERCRKAARARRALCKLPAA